jgi:hypothetical protein
MPDTVKAALGVSSWSMFIDQCATMDRVVAVW